jgi:hypothetical protein
MGPKHVQTELWPWPFRFSGGFAFGAVAFIVGVFWIVFILHDLMRVFGPIEYPMWVELFAANRPIEWLQWFVLIVCVVLAGYLAGRLTGAPSTFFLLLAFSIALIFLEDASDLRHMLYFEYTSAALGREFAGISTRVINDTAYSLLIMALPVYTLIRHGNSIWPETSSRNFLLAGFGLYGIAAALSALRHVDGFYVRLGEAIDSLLFAGRWPGSVQVPEHMTHFYVVDAFVKENLEIFGAACLLAMILSYAQRTRLADQQPIQSDRPILPPLAGVRSGGVLAAAAGLLAIAWMLVLVFDLLQVIGPLERPVWEQVFHNNRPAEWVQWTVLLTGAVLSAFISAHLSGGPARFFFVMAFGLALIFFEDSSDLRHVLFYEYWSPMAGASIGAFPTRVISDTLYFSLIAAVPLYAVLRYGRSIWPAPATRYYLIVGVILYALAGGLSAVRHLNDLYVNTGAWIDSTVFASRWPASPGMSESRAHFYVMDSFIEESLEMMGAAFLLAMVLAYAEFHRARRDAE